MALPLIITDKAAFDALDPKCREHYNETGGKWVLDSPGAVPATRLDEFRQTNIDLKKKVEAYGDITPEQAKELKDKKETFEAGGTKTKEQIEAEVEKRVGAMKTEHQKALEAEQAKAKKLEGDLESLVIDKALIEAGGELGLRATAHEDLTYRGRQQFKLDEHGKPVAKDKDGNTLYNAAGDPLTPKDFVAGLTKTAAHLFDESSGSGAGGSGQGGKGGGNTNTNPWKKETYNLTQQSQIYKDSPDQARQLAAAAGVKL